MANDKIKVKRNTTAFWTTQNPVPEVGELLYDRTTRRLYVGDGATHFVDLLPIAGSTGGSGGISTLAAASDVTSIDFPSVNTALAAALAAINTAKVASSRTIAGLDLSANRSSADVKAALVLAKADVGLGSVDNTPDSSKPVSTAQASAIASAVSGKADTSYVDSIAQGAKWKAPVRFKTVANVNLAGGGLANGTTHDGITAVTGDRVLVGSQAAPAENGIYVVPASGAASRATDADTGLEIQQAATMVVLGTANQGLQFVCSQQAVTLGTTSLTFVQFGGSTLADGSVATAKLADAAVTSAKLAPLGSKIYLGRSSTGTGAVEGVPAANLAADLAPSLIANDLTSSTSMAPSKAAVIAALALKPDLLDPVPLGTGGATLTANTHAGRYCYWTGAADATIATNTTNATRGMIIEVAHEGASGILTLGVTAPTGYKATLGPGEIGSIEFNGTAWVSGIPAAGSTANVASITGTYAVGSILTCVPATGWTGTFQWTKDGANISGQTASTYQQVTGDAGHVITCKFTPTSFAPGGGTTANVAPGQVTALTLGTATSSTQPLTWTAPASGGAPTDYEIQYAAAGSGSWSTFSDGTSTTASTTVTGLAASTSYDYRVRAVNVSGNGTYSSTATGSTAAGSGVTHYRLNGYTGATTIESGSSAGWNYESTSTVHNDVPNALNQSAVALPNGGANTGYVRATVVKTGGSGSLHGVFGVGKVGSFPFDNPTNAYGLAFHDDVYHNSTAYASIDNSAEGIGAPNGNAAVAVANGDIVQSRITATQVINEVSKDGGATFTVIHTFTRTTTWDLMIFTASTTYIKFTDIRGVGFA